MAESELRVVHNPRDIALDAGIGPWTWSILAGSRKGATSPLQVGFWTQADFEGDIPQPEEEPEPSAYDEVKYLVQGVIKLQDANTGNLHELRPGDMLWIPKGAKMRLVYAKGVEAFYAEQRELDEGEGLSDLSRKRLELSSSLQHWQQELISEFEKRNPQSRELQERASKAMPGGNTRSVLHSVPFPLAFKKAQGVTLYSLDGGEYTDFVSEYTAAMFGHSHPEIQKAIHEAVDDGFNYGGPTPHETELAEYICSRFKSVQQVRFCNSGSEANTMALACAMAFTKRKKILVFEHGYHGGTLGFHPKANAVNIPHQFEYGRYNDIEYTRPLITSSVAAILLEPLQGAGGVIPATQEFLSFLRSAADDVGAVLIFDEVMTSRLALGGLQSHFGVYPDMTTLGKYIGGGFSFGAFGGRTDIMSVFNPLKPGALPHSGTFNQNAFSMRAGLAGSKLLTTEAIARTNALGDSVREEVRKLVKGKGVEALGVTGLGSMIGFHWEGQHADVLRETFFRFLLTKDIYIGQRGFVALNICHEEKHVKTLVGAIAAFLDRVTSHST